MPLEGLAVRTDTDSPIYRLPAPAPICAHRTLSVGFRLLTNVDCVELMAPGLAPSPAMRIAPWGLPPPMAMYTPPAAARQRYFVASVVPPATSVNSASTSS